jgi:signal transduction histidine kinase
MTLEFTTTEDKRTIVVTISASLERPSADPDALVSYFPTRARRITMTEGADWGTGEEVYVNFAVEDTGRGLTDDEKKLLFMR